MRLQFVNTSKILKIITEHLILNVYLVVNPLNMLRVLIFMSRASYQASEWYSMLPKIIKLELSFFLVMMIGRNEQS
jgi:hypothetical protein